MIIIIISFWKSVIQHKMFEILSEECNSDDI